MFFCFCSRWLVIVFFGYWLSLDWILECQPVLIFLTNPALNLFRFLLYCTHVRSDVLGLHRSVGLYFFDTGYIYWFPSSHHVQSLGLRFAFSCPMSGFSTIEAQVLLSVFIFAVVSTSLLESSAMPWPLSA